MGSSCVVCRMVIFYFFFRTVRYLKKIWRYDGMFSLAYSLPSVTWELIMRQQRLLWHHKEPPWGTARSHSEKWGGTKTRNTGWAWLEKEGRWICHDTGSFFHNVILQWKWFVWTSAVYCKPLFTNVLFSNKYWLAFTQVCLKLLYFNYMKGNFQVPPAFQQVCVAVHTHYFPDALDQDERRQGSHYLKYINAHRKTQTNAKKKK